jgi:23S rRNA pseudouridine1911/1915/1917 synthase
MLYVKAIRLKAHRGFLLIHFYHEQWPVFHEDNHLLVLYKPAGLIMQRDHKNRANLLDLAKIWIKTRYNKPGNAFAGMVHRLDAPVAGVVMVARTSKAASRLSAQIREGTVEKRYLAVVQGRPRENRAQLEHSLVRAGRKSTIVAGTVPGSQKARLRYRVLSSRQGTSLLGIKLETGRRHQIRVQLAHIGCPIVGDVTYGASKSMDYGLIALLGHGLSFDHPTQAKRLVFETPIPTGWPWPAEQDEKNRPLWAIENYERTGTTLPRLESYFS